MKKPWIKKRAGVYQDARSGRFYFLSGELLASLGLADTPENLRRLEALVRLAVQLEMPEAECVVLHGPRPSQAVDPQLN